MMLIGSGLELTVVIPIIEEADRLARKESKKLKYRDCEVKKSPKNRGNSKFHRLSGVLWQ